MATLALGLCLLGCGLVSPVGEPIQVLTGVDGCYAGGESGAGGLLLPDPVYGARFNGKPVMWPVGFTGARVGNEVGFFDATGKAVATTGRRYYISIGSVSGKTRQLMEQIGAFPAAANCTYPWDFVDCALPANGSPGMEVPERSCRG
jgi:hypothetical protein